MERLRQIGTTLREFSQLMWKTLLHLIYPPLCAACHERLVSSEEGICIYCASLLVPYDPKRCEAEQRLWSVEAFRNLYSLYLYIKGNPIQRAIHSYKYHSYGGFAKVMAKRALLTLPLGKQGYDLIIAVPTTYANKLERGYNQSLLLANYIARSLGIESSDKYVLRKEHTVSQTKMNRFTRSTNVIGRFYLNPAVIQGISNRRILLVDDVLTTGATLTTILELLSEAGAKDIDVFTAAVVDPYL